MHDSNKDELSPGLEPVETMLRAHRTSPEPLELDRLKQRVLTGKSARRGGRAQIRSRAVAVITAFGLLAGSGGALALANSDNSGSGGGAAFAQYCKKKDKEHGKCDRGKDHHRDDKKKHHEHEKKHDKGHDKKHDH